MNDFLAKFPKILIAFVVISIAAGAIIYSNPPHSVCDVQKEELMSSLQGVLTSRKVDKRVAPPVFPSALESCRYGNSTGPCSAYIGLVLKIGREVRKLNSDCIPNFAKDMRFKDLFAQFLSILAYGAWGAKAPEINSDRFGWLSESDMASFCKVKDLFVDIYGKPELDIVSQKVFETLPGSSDVDAILPNKNEKKTSSEAQAGPAFGITTKSAFEFFKSKGAPDPRAEIWKRSLFSIRCEFFR